MRNEHVFSSPRMEVPGQSSVSRGTLLREDLLGASLSPEAVDAILQRLSEFMAAREQSAVLTLLREAGIAKVGLRHKAASILCNAVDSDLPQS